MPKHTFYHCSVALLLERLLHLIREGLALLEHARTGDHAPRAHGQQVDEDEDVDEGLDGRVDAGQEVERGKALH